MLSLASIASIVAELTLLADSAANVNSPRPTPIPFSLTCTRFDAIAAPCGRSIT